MQLLAEKLQETLALLKDNLSLRVIINSIKLSNKTISRFSLVVGAIKDDSSPSMSAVVGN